PLQELRPIYSVLTHIGFEMIVRYWVELGHDGKETLMRFEERSAPPKAGTESIAEPTAIHRPRPRGGWACWIHSDPARPPARPPTPERRTPERRTPEPPTPEPPTPEPPTPEPPTPEPP